MQRICNNSPRPPNVPLLRALWYLLDGIWGLLNGSWGVLALIGAEILSLSTQAEGVV